jgi:hypothetical protein
MQKRPHERPKQVKAFRNNYLAALILAAAFLLQLPAHAQVDTSKQRQSINAYGYAYKNVSVDSSFRVPRDTFKLRMADSGSIAWKNGRLWQWSGSKWDTIKASGGSGSGNLNGSLVAGRGLISTDGVTVTTDNGFLFDAAQNKATFDSLVALTARLNGIVVMPTSTQSKLTFYPYNAPTRPNFTINYATTYSNGDTNVVAKFGINLDNSKPNDGGIEIAIEQKYPPYDGAPFRWKEIHIPQIKLLNGLQYRPLTWEGRDDIRSGTWSMRGTQMSFMLADGLNTGSNADSLILGLSQDGLNGFVWEDATQFRLTHRTSGHYVGIQQDVSENLTRLTSTLPFVIQSSLHVTGNFTTSNTIGGLAVEHGGLTLTGTGQSTMYFAQGGTLNRAAIEFANHYGQISLNSPLGARGHDGSNNGGVLFIDDRDGVASVFRGFVNNTSGTSVQWLDVANNGKIGFGAVSGSESYLFKSHGNTSGSVGLNFTNSSNTSLFQIRNDGQISIPQLTGSVTEMLTITAAGVVGRATIPSGGGGSGVDTSLAWTDIVLREHTDNVRNVSIGAGKQLNLSNGTTNIDSLEAYSPVSNVQVGIKNHLNVFSPTGQTQLSFASNGSTNHNAGFLVNGNGKNEYTTLFVNHSFGANGSTTDNTYGGAWIGLDGRGSGVAASIRMSVRAPGSSSNLIPFLIEDNGFTRIHLGLGLKGINGNTPVTLLGRLSNSDSTVTSIPVTTFLNNTALTGTPTAPTAASGTNSLQIANTAYVLDAISDSLASLEQILVIDSNTTNATPITLLELILPPSSDEVLTITVDFVAMKDGAAGGYSAFKRMAFQWRSSGTTLTNGTLQDVTAEQHFTGLSTCDVNITNNGDNPVIQFTGEASTNIKVRATVTINRVTIAL